MPDLTFPMQALALVVLLAPAALLLVLGVSTLFERPLSEVATGRWIRWSVLVGLVSAVGILAGMLVTGDRHVVLDLGNWIETHPAGDDEAGAYHFSVKLVFDR